MNLKCRNISKAMSLLFSTLSRFITAFLPKSKHLLILWLQSPTAVILEPKKIKSVLKSKILLVHLTCQTSQTCTRGTWLTRLSGFWGPSTYQGRCLDACGSSGFDPVFQNHHRHTHSQFPLTSSLILGHLLAQFWNFNPPPTKLQTPTRSWISVFKKSFYFILEYSRLAGLW